MSILDITVVSVALRTFQDASTPRPAEVAWTMTGYTLALATVIPLTGWAADRFGTKRLYMLAMLLFTLGSALCATAPSLEMLVVFRVLQGLGGGMLMPLGMTIMTSAAGPDKVGRVMALLGIPMLLGPICGPILGGWLVDSRGWHWIFLINVPIGIIALAYALQGAAQGRCCSPRSPSTSSACCCSRPAWPRFLYGVSSIPGAKQEHGTIWTGQVVLFRVIGLVLTAPSCRGRSTAATSTRCSTCACSRTRQMTVAVSRWHSSRLAFFGAGLLFPLYFQQCGARTRWDPACC